MPPNVENQPDWVASGGILGELARLMRTLLRTFGRLDASHMTFYVSPSLPLPMSHPMPFYVRPLAIACPGTRRDPRFSDLAKKHKKSLTFSPLLPILYTGEHSVSLLIPKKR